jgi:hypothetical protein
MAQRKKQLVLHYNALLSDPYYLRARIDGNSPYDERVMSMPQLPIKSEMALSAHQPSVFHKGTYFFFIYNFENYYHFLYDTLPYLVFYNQIEPRPKLLIAKDHTFRKFQTEMLSLLGIDIGRDVTYAEKNAQYEKLYVATSLTHGVERTSGESASNNPPENEAYLIWEQLSRIVSIVPPPTPQPRKFYISRRTHLHGDMSNIGTNYTTRRRCLNEDAVVAIAAAHGYAEIFCEKLSTAEKITLFKNATHVLGFIGGGMANLLFSTAQTNVGCILTPEFARINTRFAHSMNHTSIKYLDICKLAPFEGAFPLYTRVQIKDASSPHNNKIGEVHGFTGDLCEVHFSNETVAGFSNDAELCVENFRVGSLIPLDGGLNSPFVCDEEGLKAYLESKDSAE